MSNELNTVEEPMGFSTYDAVNIALRWLTECDDAGYQSNSAGGWIEVFVDEYKRAMEMPDEQMLEYSDHDVIKYWHALLGEALRHIEAPNPTGTPRPPIGEING